MAWLESEVRATQMHSQWNGMRKNDQEQQNKVRK